MFSLFSAGLRASFSPFAFFVFPIVKTQKKPVFFRFCPIPPISPQKKDFLYIYIFFRVYILLFIGGIGEIGKKINISAALRRFCYWGKIGTKGEKGDFPRLSPFFPIRSRCVAFVACVLLETFRVFIFVKRCGVPSAAGYS